MTITSKPVGFSWPAILATFFLMAGSSVIYICSRRRSGRIFALFLAASLAWLPEALYTTYKAVPNITVFKLRAGASIYNYKTAILSACSTAIIMGLVLGIFVLQGSTFSLTT